MFVIYSVLRSAHLGPGISPDDPVLPESSPEMQTPPGVYHTFSRTQFTGQVCFGIPSSGVTGLDAEVRELFLGLVGVLSLSALLGDIAQFRVVSVYSPLFLLPCGLQVWLDLHPHEELC